MVPKGGFLADFPSFDLLGNSEMLELSLTFCVLHCPN